MYSIVDTAVVAVSLVLGRVSVMKRSGFSFVRVVPTMALVEPPTPLFICLFIDLFIFVEIAQGKKSLLLL